MPTARCTTSIVRLAVTAGVTVQSPRIDCRIAAAAPSCPSIAVYCACCENRPNSTIAVIRPSSTPTGMKNASQADEQPDQHEHHDDADAQTPNVIGSARLFCWLTSLATIRICFSRPAFASSSEL